MVSPMPQLAIWQQRVHAAAQAPDAAAPTSKPEFLTPRSFRRSASYRATCIRPTFTAALLGARGPANNKEAQIKIWETLSLLCALLASVCATGLYTSIKLTLSTHHEVLGAATTLAFCASTFCFMASSITGTFFRTFAMSTEHSLHDVHEALGSTFNFPSIYFRLGFLTALVGLCLIFAMSMRWMTVGCCLSACSAVILAPMAVAVYRSMSSFADEKLRFSVSAALHKSGSDGNIEGGLATPLPRHATPDGDGTGGAAASSMLL